MKKTYIEPQLQEIRLNISTIVCVSGPGFANETTTEAKITTADSRGFDWDYDEEDY